MVELRNIVKIYDNYNNNKVTALKGANLKFGSTGLVFVAGPSGGGKSTLLNILSGIDVPTSGEMLVNGVGTDKLGAKGFDGYRNNYVGIIHQDLHLLDHLSLKQNVALAMELQGFKPNMAQISILFTRLGLDGMEDRYPNQCSVGQCQRVAIARTLIKKPKILIADEPTSSVDPETRMEIYELLKEISKDVLVVAATHNRDMVERFADRLIMINDGEITADIITGKDNSNIALFDQGKVIAVEAGAVLAAGDVDKLNNIIRKNNKSGVFLCLETDAARVPEINPNAAKEIIQSTLKEKVKTKEKDKKEKREKLENEQQTGIFQFEKGNLPFKAAFRLSMVNFTSNKFRSIFTVVLSFMAIMFFALTSNMARVDLNNLTIRTFADGKDAYITFASNAQLFNHTDPFGDEREEWIASSGTNTFGKSGLIYDFGKSAVTRAPEFATFGEPNGRIYGVQKVTVDEYTQKTVGKNKYGIELEEGHWPRTSGDRKGVVISDFIATQIRTAAYLHALSTGKQLTYVPTFEEIVNPPASRTSEGLNEILINGEPYIIIGIYKTDYKDFFIFDSNAAEFFATFPEPVTAKYFHPDFMRIRSDLSNNQKLRAEYLLQNDYVTAFVSSEFITKAPLSGSSSEIYLHSKELADTENIDYYITQHTRGAPGGLGPNRKELKDTDVSFASNKHFNDPLIGNNRIRVSKQFYMDFIAQPGDTITGNTIDSASTQHFWFNIAKRVQQYNILPDWSGADQSSVLSDKATIHGYHILRDFNFIVEPELLSGNGYGPSNYSILFSETDFEQLIQALVMPSTSFIAAGSYSANTLNTIFDRMGSDITPSYADSAAISDNVKTFDSLSNTMTTASIAFAVFVAALMYSYIFQSIRSKRKNIAVIRSMGARTWDIFKIFIIEALVIAGLICFGAFFSVGIASALGNAIIAANTGMRLLIFSLDAALLLFILGGTLIVISASYMLPVFAYARHNSAKGLVRNINVKSDN